MWIWKLWWLKKWLAMEAWRVIWWWCSAVMEHGVFYGGSESQNRVVLTNKTFTHHLSTPLLTTSTKTLIISHPLSMTTCLHPFLSFSNLLSTATCPPIFIIILLFTTTKKPFTIPQPCSYPQFHWFHIHNYVDFVSRISLRLFWLDWRQLLYSTYSTSLKYVKV